MYVCRAKKDEIFADELTSIELRLSSTRLFLYFRMRYMVQVYTSK